MNPYEFGVKIAIEQARGMLADNPLTTAEELAGAVSNEDPVQSVQTTPAPPKLSPDVDYEGPNFNSRSSSHLFDNLSNLGLEVRDTTSTSI
jgi:hypothetical protein